MKIRPCSPQGLPPVRAGRPACRECGMASPAVLCLRRPGALRPPVPPTGKVPAPGTVLNFYYVKIAKPGLFSIGLFTLSAVLAAGCHPVVIQRRKRWPSETPCAHSAHLPELDCKSSRVAHKVCRPTGGADPPAFKTACFPLRLAFGGREAPCPQETLRAVICDWQATAALHSKVAFRSSDARKPIGKRAVRSGASG